MPNNSIMKEEKMKLSIIIPFVNEYPQIMFTLQSILNDAEGLDVEIICVNNFVLGDDPHNYKQDKGYDEIKKVCAFDGRIKVFNFNAKLSHWNAKNFGVVNSSGDWILFLDAHVILKAGTIPTLYNKILEDPTFNGSYHLPLSYLNALPTDNRIYRALYNKNLGVAHYTFEAIDIQQTFLNKGFTELEVPCMSSCGMAMRKGFFTNVIREFPEALGIYGGGENFVNYVIGVLGYKKIILLEGLVQHYADRRGYQFGYADWLKNRFIAVYLAGGEEWLYACVEWSKTAKRKISYRATRILLESVLFDDTLVARRNYIASEQKMDLAEYFNTWEQFPYCEKVDQWI